MNSKLETYIGFAIKKGSVVFGCDNIKRYRKKVFLILATETLSENSLELLNRAAERLRCEILKIKDYEFLANKNCKALAICDQSLAQAILNLK